MERYRNTAPPHLDPPNPTNGGVRILTERDRRLTNWRVLYVGDGEASKEKELRKGEEQVKDNPVSEG